ncbi:hypothetical protein TELCIR_05412 [Teladorsagia circumcincta]|uniref:C3H1-type domain-containing protein n=1 Tax=Teladorsagia circumcincta TaxID=45464 RepID=A0A2G9UQW3_TELCI|nr:hypothetical protein TELCIR_05412 [Teladorsagia circumcincta]
MGSRCKFAHGPEELRVADAPPRAPNARYKTKLCKNFGPYASNYCPYGLRCEFIHPNDKEYALVEAMRFYFSSMMCLATTGRREHTSDDSAIGSGSSESGGSMAHAKALAKAREGMQAPTVPIKFLRRRSMSQLTLKRFNSIENLDVAASCSQLANLEFNRGPMNSILSPLK